MAKHRFSSTVNRFGSFAVGPSLYAAQLSNGVVKIGYTRAASVRVRSLASEVRKVFGAEITEFHVQPGHSKVGGRKAEVRAIQALNQLGRVLTGRLEYFEGV